MDAQARKKALFRAKLKEQAQKTRIDSPLVRYNDVDQPVCRVCDVVLKSESLWPAHQASKKHHERLVSSQQLRCSHFPFFKSNSNAHLKRVQVKIYLLYILLYGVPPCWAETEQGVAQPINTSVIDFRRDPWPNASDNA